MRPNQCYDDVAVDVTLTAELLSRNEKLVREQRPKAEICSIFSHSRLKARVAFISKISQRRTTGSSCEQDMFTKPLRHDDLSSA